jgi:hypothetical protein
MELKTESNIQKHQDPPWLLTPYQLCLILMDKFLVPRLRLRDNDAAQDRICYAIQVSMSFFPFPHLPPSHLPTQKLLRVMAAETDPTDQFRYQTNLDAAMPSRLHESLSSKQILDVGEIFWSARYKYDETSAKLLDPPLYKMNYSVERWLGLWCRHLALKTKGPFTEIFLGLRGAVRLYSELGHFLLPYLVVDLLQTPPTPSGEVDHSSSSRPMSTTATTTSSHLKPQEKREQIMEELLLEISTVLSGLSATPLSGQQSDQKGRTLQMIESAGISAFRVHNNTKSHMSIHAIFTLLDTLTRWVDRCDRNSTSGSSSLSLSLSLSLSPSLPSQSLSPRSSLRILLLSRLE